MTSASSLSVLVVDDHTDNLEMVSAYLTGHGLHVATAATAAEGIALAMKLAPSVILMDLNLPDMDGRLAIKRLKSDAKTATIPIVLLTASDVTRIEGTVGCLIKPISPDELLEAIQRAARMTSTGQPAS